MYNLPASYLTDIFLPETPKIFIHFIIHGPELLGMNVGKVGSCNFNMPLNLFNYFYKIKIAKK